MATGGAGSAMRDPESVLQHISVRGCDAPQIGASTRAALVQAGYASVLDVLRRPDGLQRVSGVGPERAVAILTWAEWQERLIVDLMRSTDYWRAVQAEADAAWESRHTDFGLAAWFAVLSPFLAVTAPFGFRRALRVRRGVPAQNPSHGAGHRTLGLIAVLCGFYCSVLAGAPGFALLVASTPPIDQPEATGSSLGIVVGAALMSVGFTVCAVYCLLAWRRAGN